MFVAAVPVLRMLALVRGGSHAQYADYWLMVARTLRADGGIDLGGAFTLQNEHPVAVAQFLFWGGSKLFGGSNIVLGQVVIGIVLLQLVVLSLMFGTDRVLSRWTRVSLVVAFSALLFAPHGAHNFVRAMSGAAWLPANLFAVAAIWLRTRDHRFGAVASAGLASVSYATGLVAWPALLIAGLLHDRRWRKEWPVVVGAAVAYGWYLSVYPVVKRTRTARPGPVEFVRNLGRVSGSIYTAGTPGLAITVGLAGTALGIALAVLAVRTDRARAAPAVALLGFGLGASALISIGRYGVLADLGTSRYTSLAACTWIAVIALFAQVVPVRSAAVAVCVIAAAAASVGGSSTLEEQRNSVPLQDLLAVAQRIGVADGSTRWLVFTKMPPQGALRRIGHHPFDARFRTDCGLLGTRLDAARIAEGGATVGTVASVALMAGVNRAIQVSGWVRGDGHKVRCVVVTGRTGTVVGAGVLDPRGTITPVGRPRAGHTRFVAIAPIGTLQPRVFVLLDGESEPRPLDDATPRGGG